MPIIKKICAKNTMTFYTAIIKCLFLLLKDNAFVHGHSVTSYHRNNDSEKTSIVIISASSA